MKLRLFVALAFLCVVNVFAHSKEDVEEDAILTTPQLVEKYRYPSEIHSVQTSDGYILEMHRIPYGIKSPAAPNKPVVMLQHGNLCSSGDWVIMGTEKGLAYILADAGYDVWMGNARGNRYSRKHATLDPDREDGAFWNYDWHEMGVYDLPAVIDYIIGHTAEEKIFYIGHSMGTSMFYVMASEKPEYNDKIRAMFSLSPIAFMFYVINPTLRLLATADALMPWYMEMMGPYEFSPNDEFQALMGQQYCNDEAITQAMCKNMIFLTAGYDSKQLNSTMLPIIMGHTPAGASSKQLVHYSQEVNSNRFRQYDYGMSGNMDHYGQMAPPNYDIKKITCPMSLHFSDNDWLASTTDVDNFYEKLPNAIGKFRVPLAAFNHLDFLWAIDVKTLVYNKILSLMKSY